MYVIKGRRVNIRKLILQDVYDMQKWGRYDNPLYFNYNFPKLSDDETKLWFKLKMRKKNSKYYVVFNEKNTLIGYLALRNIKKFRKCATLGIVLDSNYINKGYGTEAIQNLLKYFFYELRMKTMLLKVAKYNKRAQRCYEKCGFKKIKEYIQKMEIEDINKYKDIIQQNIEDFYFDKYKNQLYSYVYKMKLDKDEYTSIQTN